MTEPRLKSIVKSFADHVEFHEGKLMMELRDEIVQVDLVSDPHGVKVSMDGAVIPATTWVYTHLAKLDVLARRISELIVPLEHFVTPSGKLLDNVDEDPFGKEKEVVNVSESMRGILDRRFGATSVLYLTSEAGEGKTSIIEHFAVQQARAFLDKEANWLLLPVPLGGRPFLRFDDVVIAALVNRLRFPFWYYEAFLELVRLGVVVPAFDGFEEMIVERGSEEARSAFKNLVSKLQSEGSLLVAARRAFFDQSFGSRARLWKAAPPDDDVLLQRLSLNRWDRSVFLGYATKRGVKRPKELYSNVTKNLGSRDHPVLTRAVLVRRLIDVKLGSDDLSDFLARIGKDQTNFFHEFVEGIVKREAERKWIDRSGGENSRLLSLAQHHELLSMVAYEMWLYSVDVLGMDVITLVIELFAEEQALSPPVARQVQERIADHSLLHAFKQGGRDVISFDHDDFRSFYLGQALGHALIGRDRTGIGQILDTKTVSPPVIAEAARVVMGAEPVVLRDVLDRLHGVLESAQQVSYVRENCGMLMLSLLHNTGEPHVMKHASFALDALARRHFSNLTFENSYFAQTSLTGTHLENCIFIDCQFERFVIGEPERIHDTVLKECRIHALDNGNGEHSSVYDPGEIQRKLISCGFQFDAATQASTANPFRNDPDLELALKFLNMFLRATSLPEQAIRIRLGTSAGHFFNNGLPKLKRSGIVGDSGTSKQRMRLMVPLEKIEEANRKARGSFEQFINSF